MLCTSLVFICWDLRVIQLNQLVSTNYFNVKVGVLIMPFLFATPVTKLDNRLLTKERTPK
jgi:hypothetical protein